MSGPVTAAPQRRPIIAPEPPRTRMSTPARLRVWAIALSVGALVLLAITSTDITRMSHQISAIAGHDAPQAATASDIYFALSDLDAQAATLLMLGNADSLSVNAATALSTFQARNAEIDSDLARAESGTTSAVDRARLGQLAAGLTLYRSWLAKAFAVQQQLDVAPAGHPPTVSLGYYAEATTVLRTQLLPIAASLRQANEAALDASFAGQRSTAYWAIGLTLGAGLALLIAYVVFQRRLTRYHRRIINPALVLATLCTAVLVGGACLLFGNETSSLRGTQRNDLGPYLALTQAQATSYDAAGDASRYLIESDPQQVAAAFTSEATCLRDGGSCDAATGPASTVLPAGGLATIAGSDRDIVALWQAYELDYQHVVSLAREGSTDSAISVLTGLASGDGTIDLYRYNTAVDAITAAHRSAYTQQLADAQRTLRFWPEIPAALMIAAIALLALGIRPRLAEYR